MIRESTIAATTIWNANYLSHQIEQYDFYLCYR